MQDTFIEYMVKKRNPLKITLLKVGVALAGALVAIFAMMVSPFLGAFSFLGVLLAAGALYGAYILITSQNIEFEYSLTNGEMDVDKITAQRKRKRLISLKFKDVEDFGQYKASEHENKQYQTKIIACDHPESDDLWFCSLHYKDKGMTLLVFNASERMLEGLKPYLPRPIFHRLFNARG
ncbi:hypothetical protein LJC63_08470 [Ruminococcaceae bacterium OttesenSCG-928-L11]|nr:hypothetical protein [Ruminococcaceae bacterium OttesenSCG-928-L11]